MSYYTSLRLQGIVTKEYMDRWIRAADIIGNDITHLYIDDFKVEENHNDPVFLHMKLSLPILYKLPKLRAFNLCSCDIIHLSVIEDLIVWTSDMHNTNPCIISMQLAFPMQIGQLLSVLKSLHGNTTLSHLGIGSVRLFDENGDVIPYSRTKTAAKELIINHMSQCIISSHIKRMEFPHQLGGDHYGDIIINCLAIPIEERLVPYVGKTKSASKTS